MHAGKNPAGRDHAAEHAEHGGQRRAGKPGRHRDAGGRKAVPAREALAAGILGEKRRKAERLIRPRSVDILAQYAARHKDDNQPSSPAYKTYTAATAPVLAMRSARRAAGRARNQPSIALYCSVFMRPPLPCFSFQHTTRCQACQIRAEGDIIELGI